MKQHRAVILALTLLITACGGTNMTTPPATPGNVGNLTLASQVSNWPGTGSNTLTAVTPGDEALGSGTVDVEGYFNLTAAPPIYSLASVSPCEGTDSTLASNPSSLRTAFFNVLIQNGGSVDLQNGQPATDRVVFMYADQAGTVQGQVRCTSTNNLVRYNLTLAQGWNAVNINFADTAEGDTTITWTTASPEQVSSYTWYAYIR